MKFHHAGALALFALAAFIMLAFSGAVGSLQLLTA
jgi:hypothetical protein